jgi:hypothetical protein
MFPYSPPSLAARALPHREIPAPRHGKCEKCGLGMDAPHPKAPSMPAQSDTLTCHSSKQGCAFRRILRVIGPSYRTPKRRQSYWSGGTPHPAGVAAHAHRDEGGRQWRGNLGVNENAMTRGERFSSQSQRDCVPETGVARLAGLPRESEKENSPTLKGFCPVNRGTEPLQGSSPFGRVIPG